MLALASSRVVYRSWWISPRFSLAKRLSTGASSSHSADLELDPVLPEKPLVVGASGPPAAVIIHLQRLAGRPPAPSHVHLVRQAPSHRRAPSRMPFQTASIWKGSVQVT